MDKKELISGIIDAFTRAFSEALAETGPEDIRVEWSLPAGPLSDAEAWTWWSANLSTPVGAKFFVGAPEETWEKFGRAGDLESSRDNSAALISRCFQKAVEEHFGTRAGAEPAGPSEAPPEAWTRVSLEIRYPAGQWPAAACVLSPELEAALPIPEKTQRPAASARPAGPTKPSDLLMQVKVPVSVCFGATQVRLKELLNLNAGSVVELDQELDANVEVRVNDRVIARGEVVAVDGYYGVRVLEIVSGESPEKGLVL